MKVTQGILKYCKIYGITFNNKYSDIKSIVTKEIYDSKFLLNNVGKVSQTSTVLSDNNMFYNIVEDSQTVNCNVENGIFINSTILGLSGGTNYINGGTFSGCTLKYYTINDGEFYNCNIDNTNLWNFGYWYGSSDFSSKWYSGVWNSGTFAGEWFGGTFNDGIFRYPGIWYDGIANGGLFSGITWYNGLARNTNFTNDCKFQNGKFNDGYFFDSTFNGGNFNGGKMYNSTINNGSIYNGTISNVDINGDTEIKGGKFTNVTINSGNVFNIDASYISVNNGNFYSGNYSNSLFNGGNIFNGVYFNITGATTSTTIHNGTFKNSIFYGINVENGNFTNCLATGITWFNGVYTDGEMCNCIWYDGYWNDGTFYAGDCYTLDISNVVVLSGTCFLQAIIDCNASLSTTTTTFVGTTTTVAPITTTTTTYSGPTTTTTTTEDLQIIIEMLSIEGLAGTTNVFITGRYDQNIHSIQVGVCWATHTLPRVEFGDSRVQNGPHTEYSDNFSFTIDYYHTSTLYYFRCYTYSSEHGFIYSNEKTFQS